MAALAFPGWGQDFDWRENLQGEPVTSPVEGRRVARRKPGAWGREEGMCLQYVGRFL